MKFLISTILLAILIPYIAFSQVKVSTINNNVFYGMIVNESTDTLKLMGADKLKVIIPRKNIIGIQEVKCYISQNFGKSYYGRFTKFSENTLEMECEDGVIREFDFKNSEISFDALSKQKYTKFGATLGTPGGINILFGYDFANNISLSTSFGMIPFDMVGIQANVMYSLTKEQKFEQGVGLAFGYSNSKNNAYYFGERFDETREWSYIGLVYDINYYGFYFQPGISIGTGFYTNPQLLFQIGYVYRFNE